MVAAGRAGAGLVAAGRVGLAFWRPAAAVAGLCVDPRVAVVAALAEAGGAIRAASRAAQMNSDGRADIGGPYESGPRRAKKGLAAATTAAVRAARRWRTIAPLIMHMPALDPDRTSVRKESRHG
ncbi:hypothetical protein [Nannocystis pusilla]|uniref:hypothetical protein n=1 Tax=Nannocystis pusilla TaxID=889268 RepID=UPI003DA669BA